MIEVHTNPTGWVLIFFLITKEETEDQRRQRIQCVSVGFAGEVGLETSFIFFLIFIYLFILFLAVLGLRFCARAFCSCGKRGPLFIAVREPLTIAASLVAEHRLQTRRLSNCGSRAQLLCGMWDLPRPGLGPVSPASAGRLSTTAPPGKPMNCFCNPWLGEIGSSAACTR